MPLSNKQIRARNLLVKLLIFLATAESCWYTVNGDINHEYSLARRLGFFLQEEYYAFLVTAGLAEYRFDQITKKKDEVIIMAKEWIDMIDGIKGIHGKNNININIEFGNKRFDRVNAHKGLNQRSKCRYQYHVIRLGGKTSKGWSHNNIAQQLKDLSGNHKTPHLAGLSSRKRTFVIEAREMFTDVIASDFGFYESLSNTNLEPAEDEDDSDDDDSDNDDDSEADDKQPPSKKPKLTADNFLGLDGGIHAGADECANFVRDLPAEQFKLLFAEMVKRSQDESGDKEMIIHQNTGNNKKMQYVRVPKATTQQSFEQHSKWIDKVLQVNGGGEDSGSKTKSAKKIAKKLIKTLRKEEGDQVLEELDLPPIQQLKMDAVKIAAMFKAGGIRSRHRRRALLKHLRHFFGKNLFDSEKKVQMLCDGHSEVDSNVVEYARVEGELKERVYYSQKNIAAELAAQLVRELNSQGIVDPKRVQGIDVMAGGDHGKGVFVFGAKIVVYMSKEDDYDKVDAEASFLFEISVAEVICSKDCAELLALTIKDELTKGLRTIAKEKLTISVQADSDSGEKTISCSYPSDSSTTCDSTSYQVAADIYIVADLACHAMILCCIKGLSLRLFTCMWSWD